MNEELTPVIMKKRKFHKVCFNDSVTWEQEECALAENEGLKNPLLMEDFLLTNGVSENTACTTLGEGQFHGAPGKTPTVLPPSSDTEGHSLSLHEASSRPG